MKIHKIISFIIVIAILLTCTACGKESDKVSKTPIDLGAPTKEYYQNNITARCVWDMTIYDNKLYIGCGDYNNNSGTTPILYYDLKTSIWQKDGEVADEQIGRYLILGDKLTIPGFDPIGAPQYGTYYQFENNEWQTYSGLLDGQHNFDLIEFDNKIFAGIGANRGLTPIICSKDGKTFERAEMIKDGKPIDTTGGECIRTHNFFILNNELYAELWYENMTENRLYSQIYNYQDGKFYFHSDLVNSLNTAAEGSQNIPPIFAKEELNGKIFLTTSFLYSTDDLSTFDKIDLPDYSRTYDIYKHKSKLYFATAKPPVDNEYEISIYSTSGKDNDFKIEATFISDMHPTSLAVNEDCFFIALGKWYGEGNKNNGTVMKIER